MMHCICFIIFQVHAHSGDMVQIVKKCLIVIEQTRFQLTVMVIAIVRDIGMVNNAIVPIHKMTHASGRERSAGETSVSVGMATPGWEWAAQV
jgi:hypothetical protein